MTTIADTEAEARLREAISCRISSVITTHAEEATVSMVAAGDDRIRIQFGQVTLFLSNFAAELLARELIATSVKLQYTLEAEAERA